jgi:urea carboxylase-associated protein 2
MTTHLDEQTPAQHRARYEALRAQARSRAASRPAASTPPLIDPASVITRETIAGGWYWSTKVGRGTTLRLINTAGNPGVSVMIWNAEDTSERYNAGDTVKLQWTTRLTRGRVLFSDMGRVLCSITEDGFGGSDTVLGGSTPASNLRRFGDASLRNTRDNFLLAAGKLGLRRPDVPPAITFFAEIRVDEGGRFHWQAGADAGAIVDLRAEMDLLVAVSNCPHPLAPLATFAPGPVDAVLWSGAPPGDGDLCRGFSEEAVRGFENTDRLFVGRAG